MAYTHINYRSGKALKEDFAAGKVITVFQPGPFPLREGEVCLEGPHYPEPHKWYVTATVYDGIVTAIKGVKKRS